jgi:hypothetical protein
MDILQDKILKRRLKNKQQKERSKIRIAFGRRIRDLGSMGKIGLGWIELNQIITMLHH